MVEQTTGGCIIVIAEYTSACVVVNDSIRGNIAKEVLSHVGHGIICE